MAQVLETNGGKDGPVIAIVRAKPRTLFSSSLDRGTIDLIRPDLYLSPAGVTAALDELMIWLRAWQLCHARRKKSSGGVAGAASGSSGGDCGGGGGSC